MRNALLLPPKFRIAGWVIFLLFLVDYLYANIIRPEYLDGNKSAVAGLKPNFFDLPYFSNITVNGAGLVIGLLLICFSKQKNEDELIYAVRLKTWPLAVLVSYVILLIADVSLYELRFYVFMVYNMLTVLVVFVIIFNVNLYKLKKRRNVLPAVKAVEINSYT